MVIMVEMVIIVEMVIMVEIIIMVEDRQDKQDRQGQTKLPLKLDFPDNLGRAAFAILAMFV